MTTDYPERLKRFEIPGRVTLTEGNGELPKIEVTTDWSTAEIYLHGAHLTDFRKHGEQPLLFLSQCSRFASGQPIRGGIPIIFPWFGGREAAPAHGFARTADWELHEASTLPEGGVSLRFGFPGSAESAMWPPLAANYAITITAELTLELILTNTSPDQTQAIENCLHAYFPVSDIRDVSLSGLEGLNYIDQADHFIQKAEKSSAISITSEVDRVYLATSGPVEILDRGWKRKIRIEKSGSASTVVWNPWITKAQQISDFGNEEYQRMLCVESGNIAENRLSLAPGKSALLKVVLKTEPA